MVQCQLNTATFTNEPLGVGVVGRREVVLVEEVEAAQRERGGLSCLPLQRQVCRGVGRQLQSVRIV